MAVADITLQPIKGQAFRLHFCIIDITTGNPITAGLTGLAAVVSKDDDAFASTTATPTEIGSTGIGYLDLSATEMNATVVIVKVSATNSNAKAQVFEIPTASLGEVTGRADGQTVLRIEQYLAQLYRLFMNREVWDTANASMTLYNDADTAAALTATMALTSAGKTTRGKRA